MEITLRKLAGLVFALSFITTTGLDLLESPNEQAKVVQSIDPEHKLKITTQDWVQVTDIDTGTTGWAKLSQLQSTLRQGGRWEYSMMSNNQESKESITYQPISSEMLQKWENEQRQHLKQMQTHINSVFERHSQLMKSFHSSFHQEESSTADSSESDEK